MTRYFDHNTLMISDRDDHGDNDMVTTRSERIDKTLNVEQAEATRDALAKAIYFR